MEIVAVLITGVFGILTYIIQKRIDHQKRLQERRREVYSDFFLILGQVAHGNAEAMQRVIHARSQIALYGTDPVVSAANALVVAVGTGGDVNAAALNLLHRMRKEIFPSTNVQDSEIHALMLLK